MQIRCAWAEATPLEMLYHDQEWGCPIHDDLVLFEFLLLEGMQAGLSWRTVLQKRENYRLALAQFDPVKLAVLDETQQALLLSNTGLIRNRAKIAAIPLNARAFLQIQAEYGQFADYLWGFVNGQTIQNNWQQMADIPAQTALSDKISKDLKKRGFKFVGSTICYAYMQAVGLVNDHLVTCFRHAEVLSMR
ncbi:DNA-3-methyladenine glycosylase I [Beggiatoa leptomitoformis]|uniref:DNA-3-methyladenine glycosylase I n=1 Tax=Beggiatoa leptomitoformis TaxID=288004 RepID=A0A2N9YA34_9GAMM|nr:DNA-3-methyladenine glycosylase I [Beggiatoa leptomitoformis]ALG67267.1 DNA-3-methyladenine glycosylase I [Beggiatoa leptomitoformis]AUI67308.1 DNA-3-methyladenine glycosylase I [Beggiatoa leptomitoformis]